MSFSMPDRLNMATYFLDSNLEAGRGARVALISKDRHGEVTERSYDEVAALANRTGNALRSLGVEIEQRILLAVGDGPEFVGGWFGALKIGAVVTAVNPLLPPEDYPYYLEYTRARVAICDADSLPAFLAALPEARYLKALVVVGDASATSNGRAAVVRYDEVVLGADARLDPTDTHRDDVAVWLFTSGTTGKPKGAVHTHQDFVFNCEHYAKSVLRYREDDRVMGVPRLYFGYGTGSNLMFPFEAGATCITFHEHPKAETVLENVDRFRPTALVNVPTTIHKMLLAEEVRAKCDLSSLRFMTSAGEALPPETYHAWRTAYPGCEILDGIGSAEMFHVFISNAPGDVKPGTLGKVVPGYEVRIVGPDGLNVEDGEVGTLWVGGPSAALCYWHDREKSRETMRGDWIVTADQFRRDEDGYFHYCGRADDMLKVGGIWVSPLEIEECLLGHDAVKECAVVGCEEDGLVLPKAFVVPRDGHAGDEALATALLEHVRSKLARYKAPREVRFLDALPRNDRGKVRRTALRDLS